MLFVRAEFSDAKMKVDPEKWKSHLREVNDMAQNYWHRVSYGRISRFDSKCTDIYELPEPSTEYQGGGNTHKLNQAMRSLAEQDEWNLKEFDQVILSYPGVLNQPFGAAGLPGTVWLPGRKPWGPGFIHELGHAFGVGHASAIEGKNGQPYPGEHREGRDGLFMMGSEDARLTTVNLPMKYVMKFIDDSFIVDVTEPQVVRLFAFDVETLPETRTLAARFQIDDKTFWVSYAPETGKTWADQGGMVYTEGVIVQQRDKQITRILDFTPGSQGGNENKSDYVDTRDGALQVDQQYTFPDSHFTIKPLKTGKTRDGWRWIDVKFLKQRKKSKS